MRLLFALILLTSCASTLTTQELQALTKGKPDYELCSEIANVIWYGGSVSKYTVDELKERRVNCMDHSEAILCLLYTSPSPRDRTRSRMPSSA